MSAAPGAQGGLRFDYTAVGHVTADVLADGRRQAGGSAFYAALQAARLGLRALIVTCGVPAELEQLLAPYRAELEVEIRPAPQTTTLTASGWDAGRSQRMLAWAGPIPGGLAVDTKVLHLAPVARELPRRHSGAAGFVGLTPQGLVRSWQPPENAIALSAPDADARELARGCDALVLSEQEREVCGELIEAAAGAGAISAVTAGARPLSVLSPAGATLELEVPALEAPVDDLGAGDVFAAALFLALAERRELRDAVDFANAAAAVRMAGAGPQAIGDPAAIAARMRAARPG